MALQQIPVVDIFAGPGGLSEGFGAYQSGTAFRVVLSIERDRVASETLALRKVVRGWRALPDEYLALMKGELALPEFRSIFAKDFAAVAPATWQAELGVVHERDVRKRIQSQLGRRKGHWVLIGGPPCQAYSLVGRSRMKGRSDFERDKRHFLYREYLRIVAAHAPSVFVMENVKGILSSTIEGQRIFHQILQDLRRPGLAIGHNGARNLTYRLYGFGREGEVEPIEDAERAADFLVRAEDYGIPQARHRIFVVGVRDDIPGHPLPLKSLKRRVSVASAISDLPELRSKLSREPDGFEQWLDALSAIRHQDWTRAGRDSVMGQVATLALRSVREARQAKLTVRAGGAATRRRPGFAADWYRSRTAPISQHESRAHMRSDLHRYLFAACFASLLHRSPKIRDFPESLWPQHENVGKAVDGKMFEDRFRVQIEGHPSSTVTSHIAKDGHYFIHYDPKQCRSLTVREAARLQTFPDDYFFTGNRTQQYAQIGNAVPPLLAVRVAESVHEFLRAATGRR
jgi:DNA (cytosine-5)-methyltransferase 1